MSFCELRGDPSYESESLCDTTGGKVFTSTLVFYVINRIKNTVVDKWTSIEGRNIETLFNWFTSNMFIYLK